MNEYFCCDEQRRLDVLGSANLNGIDFLEVDDGGTATASQPQRLLRVHFLKSPAPPGLVAANIRISGGERLTAIVPDRAPVYEGDVLAVHVNQAGDFSPYTLRLVEADGSGDPLAGLDPLFASVQFSFKVECPSAFDCQTDDTCAAAALPEPQISYLAKDYASFRQSMLDRLAVLVPDWQEQHTADLGIALVELLAYIADQLSYQQDAIGTEAYLGTARLRTSVRRHARLVDYLMHEGCCARAWIQVTVNADNVVLPAQTQFLRALPGIPTVLTPGSAGLAAAIAQGPRVFESVRDTTLFQAHNSISFHTWGERRCCLPKGATQATLKGKLDQLQPGSVLVFEEVLGPQTGLAQDADPSHRQAVRLTQVKTVDARGRPLVDPLYNQQPVTRIQWATDDALDFPLCLSARILQGTRDTFLTDVSVARANIVLADEGATTGPEVIGTVPAPTLFRVPGASSNPCTPVAPKPVPPRFRPSLARAPLTWSVPFDPSDLNASARTLSRPDPATARPIVRLSSTSPGSTAVSDWTAQRDLLNSQPNATDFVVETDDDGVARLRFGDNDHGIRPAPNTSFKATYRVGNGSAGNLGPASIAHVVASTDGITGIRNPLPAWGGTDPESVEVVRRNAPQAFRTQQRAVTAGDYAAITQRRPDVLRAAASFRWTGSWRTVFVTVDRTQGQAVDTAAKQSIKDYLNSFRMAGHDVEVEAPQLVPLELNMRITVAPDYFRNDIAAALRRVFSSKPLPGGGRGVFHPDNFPLGQSVYVSPLYAAATGIDGVASAQIVTFRRWGKPGTDALASGVLRVGPLEAARLDNNPDFPERGVFNFSLEGGK